MTLSKFRRTGGKKQNWSHRDFPQVSQPPILVLSHDHKLEGQQQDQEIGTFIVG
jgi:hypothetical protein